MAAKISIYCDFFGFTSHLNLPRVTQQDGFYMWKHEIRSIWSWPGHLKSAPSILLSEKGEKRCSALFPVSPSRLGTLLPLLIRGNNYESGQVIKLKHKWLHEPGWLFYKLFPGLIKEKYGSAHPQCHSAAKNEEKKAPATNFNKSLWSFKGTSCLSLYERHDGGHSSLLLHQSQARCLFVEELKRQWRARGGGVFQQPPESRFIK